MAAAGNWSSAADARYRWEPSLPPCGLLTARTACARRAETARRRGRSRGGWSRGRGWRGRGRRARLDGASRRRGRGRGPASGRRRRGWQSWAWARAWRSRTARDGPCRSGRASAGEAAVSLGNPAWPRIKDGRRYGAPSVRARVGSGREDHRDEFDRAKRWRPDDAVAVLTGEGRGRGRGGRRRGRGYEGIGER
jgi:hypothetical protein